MTGPEAPLPPTPTPEPDPLRNARIRATYVVLGLVSAVVVADIVTRLIPGLGLSSNVDLGVLVTLMGGLVSLVGAGAVIRLFGGNGRK
jgi:hypothetical protein